MKFSIKDFFCKCDQIRRRLRIWSHLLKKSEMENFIFCAVLVFICDKQVVIKPNNQAVIKPFLNSKVSLCKKCPYSEFFSSVFTRILIEYGKILPN